MTKVVGLTFALIFSIAAASGMAGAFAGQTTRVSLNSAGDPMTGNGLRGQGLSADGHYVVFGALATNLGASGQQVYRRTCATHDCTVGTTDVVSVRPDGTASSGFGPSVSANGRYVAFVSLSTDLIAGKTDTNNSADVFLRDMLTGTTKLVSATPTGDYANAGGTLYNAPDAHVISDDSTADTSGILVAFASSSTDLVSTSNNATTQIYVKNLTTGEVVLASTHEGLAGNGASSLPALSGDGRFVAFASLSTNLTTPALGTASPQIYVRDLSAQTTSLESVTWDGAVLLGGQNSTPTLSRNGRYLAFESTLQLDNRSDHDVATWDVYLRDRGDGTTAATTVHVSRSDTPTFFPTLDSRGPSISADGNFVAFQSSDFGLVLGDGNGIVDVFLYDRATTALSLVSRNDDGVQADFPSSGPSLSEHGGLVLFASAATNLVPVPFTNTAQLYLRNLVANQAPVLQPVGQVDLVEAQPLHLNWRFSDDDSSTSWNATVDYGDGAGKQHLDLASDKTFVLDHLYTPGEHDLKVEVSDDAFATGSLAIRVVVTNLTPVVNLPSTLDLGFAPRMLDISGTFRDPGSNETYSATVDYGVGAGPQTLALGPYSPPIGSFTLHYTYANAGTYNVAVTVSDGRGVPTTANLQVYLRPNQAPVLQPVGQVDLVEAQPLHLNWRFSDDDASTAWNATVNYGDGAGKQTLDLAADKTFVLDHLYAPGAYDLTVEVTDDALATGRLVTHVVVSNVAPSVGLLSTLDLAFRTLDTFGTFVDPGSNETYAATVNYGDATGTQPLPLGPYSSSPNVGGTFTLHHTYASAGTYNVAVTVSDGRGDPTTATLVVTVGRYSYEFQDPAESSFVVGRNLPVKFTVRGPDGSPVFDPTVQVDVIDESGSVRSGPYIFGDQPSRAVTWSGDSYHVNVDTRDLAAGMYWLRVKFASPTLTGEFTLGTTGTATGTKPRPVR